MPIIVDVEQKKKEILLAFERCLEHSPMESVSIRDIAKEAGMAHSNLLNYFDSKEDIIVSYIKYTRDFMTEKCKAWFAAHDRRDYDSNLSYMNAFMSYVANGEAGETRPSATTQTYVLAHYNTEVARLVKEEYAEWRSIMEQCLISIYGDKVGKEEAEAMMILIAGTFICNYNGALTGEINDNIVGLFNNLAD